MASDGSDVKPFYDGLYAGTDAIFSADGKSILFSGGLGEAIIRVGISAEGDVIGKPEKIIDGTSGKLRQISISSNGKRLVYSSLVTTSNIWSNRIDSAGKVAAAVKLTENAFTRNVAPAFSPTGDRIAFASLLPGPTPLSG